MTDLMHHSVMGFALSFGAWFTAGLLLGAGYFLTLRWNVRLFAARSSMLLPLGIQLGRFALMAVVLTIVAIHFGALPLLAAAAGVLATRTIVIRMEVSL